MRMIVLPLIALGAAACAGDAGSVAGASNSVPAATVSFMTTAPTTTGSSASTVVSADGADTLHITSAELLFSRMELRPTTSAGCDTAGDDHNHHCAEVERSFVRVELPIDSGVNTAVHTTIPAGTYVKLEAIQGVLVRVTGTFRNAPFVYTTGVDRKLELEFSPPLVVDTNGFNITIGVDVASWFLDPQGAIIDPTSTTDADAALVASNVRRSFRAFRDDHRNGHDDGADDHGNEGAGHGGHGDDGSGHDVNDDHGNDG